MIRNGKTAVVDLLHQIKYESDSQMTHNKYIRTNACRFKWIKIFAYGIIALGFEAKQKSRSI